MKTENTRVKVPIPDSVFIRWKLLYQHGDLTQITIDNKFKKQVVRRAWGQRKGSYEVISAMTKFYAERQKQVNEGKKIFKGIKSLSQVELTQ